MTGNDFLHKIDQLKHEIENAKGQIKICLTLKLFELNMQEERERYLHFLKKLVSWALKSEAKPAKLSIN